MCKLACQLNTYGCYLYVLFPTLSVCVCFQIGVDFWELPGLVPEVSLTRFWKGLYLGLAVASSSCFFFSLPWKLSVNGNFFHSDSLSSLGLASEPLLNFPQLLLELVLNLNHSRYSFIYQLLLFHFYPKIHPSSHLPFISDCTFLQQHGSPMEKYCL